MKPTVVNARGLSFCTIPKCGGSSVRRAVLEGLGYSETADHHHPALNLTTPDKANGFCAALVRHPLERLVSCWSDKIARFKPGGTPGMIRAGYRVGMPFEEFAKRAAAYPRRDAHTRRQVEYLRADRPVLLGRIEEAGRFWKRLRLHFGWLPRELGRFNASEHGEWREYFTGDLRDTVIETYGEDLNLWYAARCA